MRVLERVNTRSIRCAFWQDVSPYWYIEKSWSNFVVDVECAMECK